VKISSFECEGLEPKLLDRRSWWICRCWFNQSPQKKNLQKEKLKGDLEFYGTGCASFTHVQFFQLSWSTPKVFEFWSGPSAERGVKKDSGACLCLSHWQDLRLKISVFLEKRPDDQSFDLRRSDKIKNRWNQVILGLLSTGQVGQDTDF